MRTAIVIFSRTYLIKETFFSPKLWMTIYASSTCKSFRNGYGVRVIGLGSHRMLERRTWVFMCELIFKVTTRVLLKWRFVQFKLSKLYFKKKSLEMVACITGQTTQTTPYSAACVCNNAKNFSFSARVPTVTRKQSLQCISVPL